MKKLSDLIIPTWKQHFLLEFSLLDKLYWKDIETRYITEDRFVYDGQIDLVMFLVKDIIKKRSPLNKYQYFGPFIYTDNELKNFKNIFFKKLTVVYNNSVKTGYKNNDNYNELSYKFKSVVININYNDYSDFRNLACCICHELLHAWYDYNTYLKKANTHLLNITGKDTKYSKFISPIDFGDNYKYLGRELCKKVLYQLSKVEKQAYFSELQIILKTAQIEINNLNDAIKEFENSDFVKDHYTIYNYFVNLDDKYKQQFADTYNEINETNLSVTQVFKRLSDKYKEYNNDLDRAFPKVYKDYMITKFSVDSIITEIPKDFTKQTQLESYLIQFNEYTPQHLHS